MPTHNDTSSFWKSLLDGAAKYLVILLALAIGGLVVQHFDVRDLQKRVTDLEEGKTGSAVVLSAKLTLLELEINRRFSGLENQLNDINSYLREHNDQ